MTAEHLYVTDPHCIYYTWAGSGKILMLLVIFFPGYSDCIVNLRCDNHFLTIGSKFKLYIDLTCAWFDALLKRVLQLITWKIFVQAVDINYQLNIKYS